MFDSVVKKYLGSFVRHAVTALSGSLITIGVSQSQADQFADATTPIVVGIATYLLGQGLSLIEKRTR